MRFRKELLKVGKHHTKAGILNATPEWIDERIEQYRRMRDKGIKSPIAWGHNLTALPLDAQARQDEIRFHASKYKAGDVLNITRDGDTVYLEGDVPAIKRIDDAGHLIHEVEVNGVKQEAAISEVSAGFHDWTDGQGETHKDALIHVALCSLPVSMNQKGFEPVNQQPILLSTSTWFGAIEPIADADTRKQLATEPDMADDTKTPETETPEPEKEKEETPKTATKPVPEMLKEIGDKFKVGLPDTLPSDPIEALNLLYVAACAVAGPNTEDDLMAEPNPTNVTGGGIMLSTAVKEKGWAGTAAKALDTSTRDALKARIEALKPRGLQDADYKALTAQVPAMELSVCPDDGKVLPTSLHSTLDILERNLPSRKELATETELEEVPNPNKPPDPAEKAQQTLATLEANGVIKPLK